MANRASARARKAIATVMAVASLVGGRYMVSAPNEPPIPAAVKLAIDANIIPWEGLVLSAHWDRFSKQYDICHGDTRINGKPVTFGMHFTPEECYAILVTRVINDYYKPLTQCIAGFDTLPISLQASMISGAYNVGVGSEKKRTGICGSSAARFARARNFYAACEAQTAFNKAGGQFVQGLDNRRKSGDATRIGEAELCESMPATGLPVRPN
ncbi:glycoside hydrolase [Mesorhizobium sp.]|uniref:glycoside hydrolase family protein n=1 Tax=Mesorhizobium sp. TaxID=1871066 RepID=UPI000FE62ECD|nr:glycoside hydrolase [Mesorhizobium sp.]RWF64949.1 MAG: glycoside hydrolase [Mesorhizobium sp.]